MELFRKRPISGILRAPNRQKENRSVTERATSFLNRYSAPAAFVALLLLVVSSTSIASPTRSSLDDLEDAKPNQTTGGDTLENLDDAFNESATTFVKKCMLAFGHQGFCDCVSLRQKRGVPFESYVRFATNSKGQLKFASSSVRLRTAIDSAQSSSSACRKLHFGNNLVVPQR